jgi:hypothetical protein
VFVPLGITNLPAPATADERAAAWRVLVAGRPVSGFAVLDLLDELTPGLERLRARERDLGLDRYGHRAVMARRVDGPD